MKHAASELSALDIHVACDRHDDLAKGLEFCGATVVACGGEILLPRLESRG